MSASPRADAGLLARGCVFVTRRSEMCALLLCAPRSPLWVEETTLVYVERFFSRRSYMRNDRFVSVELARAFAVVPIWFWRGGSAPAPRARARRARGDAGRCLLALARAPRA